MKRLPLIALLALLLVTVTSVHSCPPTASAPAPVVVMVPHATVPAAPMLCPEAPPTASTIMMVPSTATYATAPTAFATTPTVVYQAAVPARTVYPTRLSSPFVPRARTGIRVGW